MSTVRFLNRDQVIKDLTAIASALRNKNSNVQRVILFGSIAKGNCTPRSDADILIVLGSSSRRFIDRIGDFLPVFIDAPVAVDIFPYIKDEIESNKFAHNAAVEGIVLA